MLEIWTANITYSGCLKLSFGIGAQIFGALEHIQFPVFEVLIQSIVIHFIVLIFQLCRYLFLIIFIFFIVVFLALSRNPHGFIKISSSYYPLGSDKWRTSDLLTIFG